MYSCGVYFWVFFRVTIRKREVTRMTVRGITELKDYGKVNITLNLIG